MQFHFWQAVRAFILLALAAYIFKLHHSGEIIKYIHPHYLLFSQIASLLLLFLFFVQATRIWSIGDPDNQHTYCGPWGCEHDHGYAKPWHIRIIISYLIISLPIATGFFFPVKSLDSSLVHKKGIIFIASEHHHPQCTAADPTYLASVEQSKASFSPPLEEGPIVLNRDNFTLYASYIAQQAETLIGRAIILEGELVYDQSKHEAQLALVRFLVNHCVADATALGFYVEFPNNIKPSQTDIWIVAAGYLDIKRRNQYIVPYIKVVQWERKERPEYPYVYH